MDLESLATCIKELVKDYSLGNVDKIKKNDKIYCCWNNLMRRCYSDSDYKGWKRYKDCSVCKEWHTYSNFRNWYIDNYYEIPDHKMELDKDIIKKGNKCYSSETCIWVPHEINTIFTSNNKYRGDLPVGVSKYRDKFKAQCNGQLGLFNNPDEAFHTYKEAKEKRIRDVAEQYRQWIPDRLYQAMVNWQVEIDD